VRFWFKKRVFDNNGNHWKGFLHAHNQGVAGSCPAGPTRTRAILFGWRVFFCFVSTNTFCLLSANPTAFNNIIFDLGGVIINLSVPDTFAAFAKASGKSLDDVSKYASHQVFLDYEKGLISDEEFRQSVKEMLDWKADAITFDSCWNAMLLDIPVERLRLLERLKKDYRIFLLSNTNEIHLRKFNEILNNTEGRSEMDHYFHKAYYSHRMKMRKPDKEIFEFVLNENQLNPKETLFLDDNVSNLEGAAQTGIQTFHVKNPDLIFSLF